MIDLASLKQRDEQLTAELEADRANKKLNPPSFRVKVVKLLWQMAQAAERETDVEDYSWLETAATRWKVTASSVLGDPIPFSLPVPAAERLRPPRTERVWVRPNLEGWITNKAWEIFKRRAISRVYQKSEEEILAETPSTPEDYERDAHTAKIYFGCDVLDGKFDFVRDFSVDSYPLLEGDCWLKEVKEMKAYLYWRARSDLWGEKAATENYLRACLDIRDRTIDPAVKASQTAFEPVGSYLQTGYLRRATDNAWELDPAKTENLIAVKARRVWEITGRTNRTENWLEAESFVREFYSSILPAVTKEDDAALAKIVELLQLGNTAKALDLANCFEAAIAIHFLNASKVRNILGDRKSVV